MLIEEVQHSIVQELSQQSGLNFLNSEKKVNEFLESLQKEVLEVIESTSGAVDTIVSTGRGLKFLNDTLQDTSDKAASKKGRELLEEPVAAVVANMIRRKVETKIALKSFVEAAILREKEINIEKKSEKLSERNRTLIGHEHLESNHWLNYLRLIGLIPPIGEGLWHTFELAEKKNPTEFAGHVVAKSGLTFARGKNVLSLGPGSGRDEKLFLGAEAKKTQMVDKSGHMLKKLKATKEGLKSELQDRFEVPERTEDMLEVLSRMEQNGETVDIIYSHSTLHYFDDDQLQEIFRLCKACLNPGGHLAFAIKGPKATFDGQGIRLTCQESQFVDVHGTDATAEHRTMKSAWLNPDGQIRFFRDSSRIRHMVREKDNPDRDKEEYLFSIVDSGGTFENDYEVEGQGRQELLYFIFKKEEGEITRKNEDDIRERRISSFPAPKSSFWGKMGSVALNFLPKRFVQWISRESAARLRKK